MKTYRSGREHLLIDKELYAGVKKVGANAGTTLFATLLAAFEVLVHRLSGQSDFVVGIPLAGQIGLENPSLVAHCVNTVPLRTRLDPDAPFAEHVRVVLKNSPVPSSIPRPRSAPLSVACVSQGTEAARRWSRSRSP